MQQQVRLAADGASFGVIVAAYNSWLHPALEAALLILSVVWVSIQIGSWAVKKWRK
jgi:hypothetical protein